MPSVERAELGWKYEVTVSMFSAYVRVTGTLCNHGGCYNCLPSHKPPMHDCNQHNLACLVGKKDAHKRELGS